MPNIVKADKLVLAYNKEEPVIKNSTIQIRQKDFIFITGKSGSGKSTFLKSLYGELPLSGGSLEVCGIDLNRISTKNLNLLRKHIGVIFQDYKLINEWNVERNVMLPLMIAGYSKAVCKMQAHKLLKHVKLSHKAEKFPLELSGGEQQRVAMARALAHNPLLIVADEPTGNLDDYSSEVIWNLLKSVRQHIGSTIVVATHRIPQTLGIDYKHYFLDEGVMHDVS
ncbi:MAG: ABC transporter ATP-binding protein [Campylobacteraceae bacterium 4484_4]|nr:MAG: ABC transporter ATP-binding protein [Campylobacteraceae bacterium 4484_4]